MAFLISQSNKTITHYGHSKWQFGSNCNETRKSMKVFRDDKQASNNQQHSFIVAAVLTMKMKSA